MELARLALKSFTWSVFNMDYVHGGGAYHGKIPRHLRNYDHSTMRAGARDQKRTRTDIAARRWKYRLGRPHFRYSTSDFRFASAHTNMRENHWSSCHLYFVARYETDMAASESRRYDPTNPETNINTCILRDYAALSHLVKGACIHSFV